MDRAESPKGEIPDRQQHEALGRLAVECRGTLGELSSLLERAGGLLDSGGGDGAAVALQDLKHCSRAMGEIEGRGLPPPPPPHCLDQ